MAKRARVQTLASDEKIRRKRKKIIKKSEERSAKERGNEWDEKEKMIE